MQDFLWLNRLKRRLADWGHYRSKAHTRQRGYRSLRRTEFLEDRALLTTLFAQPEMAVVFNPISAIVADLNGDRQNDVIIVGPGIVESRLGNGDGTFQAPSDISVIDSPQSISAVDLNHDGRLDLVVAKTSATAPSFQVLLGNGDGTFAIGSSFTLGTGTVGTLVAADFNKDGNVDVAIPSSTNGANDRVNVWLGDGNGAFHNGTSIAMSASSSPTGLATADFNSDGKLDLVVALQNTGSVTVLLGNGDGTFLTKSSPAAGGSPVSVAAADLNHDGITDLVTANAGDNSISVLEGNGNGTFFKVSSNIGLGTRPQSIAVADISADGIPDLVTADPQTDNVSVLTGSGNGLFSNPTTFGVGDSPTSVVAVDVGSSHAPDVVVADQGSASLSVLMNGAFVPLARVTSTTPASFGGSLPVGTTWLNVTFSEQVVGANSSCNFRLQNAGADGLLGTADDSFVTLSTAYSNPTTTLTFPALTAGAYRLTVEDSVTNLLGDPLDGTSQNTAGGNYTTDFAVDGTRASLLKDIDPNNSSSNVALFAEVGSNLFFTADDGVHGKELWVSDGTSGATDLLKDIYPNNTSSNPVFMATVGSNLIFTADDGAHGKELWISDGTSTGTTLLKDIYPNITSSTPALVATIGNQLFFTADDGVHGKELWITNGTSVGTVLLKDIYSNNTSSNPAFFASVGNNLFFTADDGVHGKELWITDGTGTDTVLLNDIYPNNTSSNPILVATVGGKLFFTADDGLHGAELWISDGTSSGTSLLKDICPNNTSSNPTRVATIGNDLLFTADDGIHGKELWITDGTSAGTVLLKDIYSNNTSSNPVFFANASNNLYFTADDGIHGKELWITDGTSAGTVLLNDIYPNSTSSNPTFFASVGNKTLFTADDGIHGKELWVSDGTTGGTTMLNDIYPNSASSSPILFATLGNKVMFTADDGTHGKELWVTDGTGTGTYLLDDIYPNNSSSTPALLAVAGNNALFTADDGVHGSELWVSNGTSAGTFLLDDIKAGSTSSSPTFFASSGNEVFFTADDGVHGQELWVSDGNVANTFLMQDINPGSLGSSPQFLDTLGSNLWLLADDGTHGMEPWVASMSLPPLVNAGGPYVVVAGQSISLDSSLTVDDQQPNSSLNMAWDLDGDGIYGETGSAAGNGNEVGTNPTFIAPHVTTSTMTTVGLRVINRAGYVRTATTYIHIVAPPTVTDLSPSVSGGTIAAGTTAIHISFDEPVLSATQSASYSLQSNGPDGILGNGDDTIVPFTASYDSGAALGPVISVSGSLFNSSSATPASGTFLVQFSLFTTSADGIPEYSEERQVAPDSTGSFSVTLGAFGTLPSTLLNNPVYVEIKVLSDGSPFTQRIAVNGGASTLSSQPYEIRTAKAVGTIPIQGQSATLTMATGLAAGAYRLTITPGVTDPSGIGLDGLGTGISGTNYSRDFNVIPEPKVQFTTVSTSLGGISASSITDGDLNGDGIQDLILADRTGNGIYAMLGTGGGQYAAPTLIDTGNVPTSITLGDLNGDHKLDLVVTNAGDATKDGKVDVYFGTGDGHFDTPVTYSAEGQAPQSVQLADLNGDGKLDMVIANDHIIGNYVQPGHDIYTFVNPSFRQVYQNGHYATQYVPGYSYVSSRTPDITLTNVQIGSMGVLLNDGIGGFSNAQLLTTASSTPPLSQGIGTSSVQIADFNGDGRLDIGFIINSGYLAGFFLGTGAGKFYPHPALAYLPANSHPVATAVGDFNHDGRTDLIVTEVNGTVCAVGYSSPTGVPRTQGTTASFLDTTTAVLAGTFDGANNLDLADVGSSGLKVITGDIDGWSIPVATTSGGTTPKAIAVADVNSDGKSDLIVVNSDTVATLVSLCGPATEDLLSPSGKSFDVQTADVGAGQLIQGTNNAFDGVNRLQLGGVDYAPAIQVRNLANSNQTVITPTQTIAGLSVIRQITVPSTGSQDFARTVDVYTNNTAVSITTTVHLVGNLGSDTSTRIFTTSSGDATLTPADEWFGTDSGANTPALIHFIHGPLGLRPSSVDVVGDNIEWTYQLTVPAGKTVELAQYTIQAATDSAAVSQANALVMSNGFGGQAAAFLTATDLASLANYQFDQAAPTLTSINCSLPAGSITNATSVTFLVTFNEPVTGIAENVLTDFALTGTAITGATIQTPTTTNGGLTWSIPVTGLSSTANGTVGLNLIHNTGITDLAANPLSTSTLSGQTYTLDHVAPTLKSINRSSPVTQITNLTSVTFLVTFSEPVAGVNTNVVADFALTGTGINGATVGTPTTTSGGLTWSIPVTGISSLANGTLGLNLVQNTGIVDQAGNSLTNATSTGQTFTLDHVAPTLTAINRYSPASQITNQTSLTFVVTFSEAVTGVNTNVMTDFALAGTAISGGQIGTPTTSNGVVWLIPVTGLSSSANGNAGLILSHNTGIKDAAGNSLSTTTWTGQSFTLDHVAPAMLSMNRYSPASQITNQTSLSFVVTFSEAVTGVNTNVVSDFALSGTAIAGGKIGTPTTTNGGLTWSISVTGLGISANGTVGLSLTHNTGIKDPAGNLLATTTLNSPVYILDHVAPALTSINRYSPASQNTNLTSVTFALTFSKAVTGVNTNAIADFALAGTAISGGHIGTPTTSNGLTWLIPVTGLSSTANGTVGLSLIRNTGIKDQAGNTLATTSLTSQNFTLDHAAPLLMSINRYSPTSSFTNQTSASYVVTFSEPVSGVNSNVLADFALAGSAITGGKIGTPTTSNGGRTWLIPVTGLSNTANGTVGLNLTHNTGIKDLAGNQLATSTLSGQVYTLDHSSPTGAWSAVSTPTTVAIKSLTITFSDTFSNSMQNVTISNFTLNGTNLGTLAGVTISAVGNVYTINGLASYNTAKKSYTLAVVFPNTIKDLAGNALLGTPAVSWVVQ